ncbi:TetR/AcrR family transcriptional regulator [Jatrophihabitans fulvus]
MTSTERPAGADEQPARPLRRDAARNRAALVQAGREVFAERGLDASLDDIAARAGVGVGTAYRHFANKHELAKAIFTEEIERIIAFAEDAAADPDPWNGVVRFLEEAVGAQSRDRGLREVMMGVHDEVDTERINDAMSPTLARLVDRAKAAGAVRADAESSDLGAAVLMLCAVSEVYGGQSPDVWRRYVPILLDGLRPGAPLPVPPLDDEATKRAFSEHKQRYSRTM